MPNQLKVLLLLISFLGLKNAMAQTQPASAKNPELVQFTGFVVNIDSSKTLPYVTIRIKGTNKGTYSDMQGYFSFVAKKNDVIVFTCIGFEPRYFKIPETIPGSKLNSVITLVEDTFFLPEMVYRPNPTPEELDYMFSRTTIPMDELTIAQNNLRRKPSIDFGELANDALANSSWTFNQVANRAYYAGQAQPIPVLDVFAWSQFLKSLDKKKKKK
ncbi:MAG: carboxypeptidase-like regulatory domain-containing protein [Bacteroidia bacterium]